MSLFLQKKNSLEHACWRFKTVKDQGVIFQEKKTLSALVRRSGLPEIQGLFFPGKTHQRWARPCSGLQKIQSRFFSGKKKHSLEHACWTFRASRKSNSAKVIFYCKANKNIFTKQLSCAAQITQGAYTDVAFWFHPKRLSLRTQDKTLTLFFSGKGGTHTPPLREGFQTAWLITGQTFRWTNLKSGSSLLTFWDLSSHICQIFMRLARWGDLHFRKTSDFLTRIWDCFGQQIWNLVWNGSIWLGRSSY